MQTNSSSTLLLLFSISLLTLPLTKSLNQSTQPPNPSPDCAISLSRLTPCLTYVTNGSNLTRPEKGCCANVDGVISSEQERVCWCQLVAGYNNYGVQIDTIRVLILPTICRVRAPPSSLCSVIVAPIGSLSPSKGYQEPGVSAIEAPASGNSSCRITCYTWLHLVLTVSFITSGLIVY